MPLILPGNVATATASTTYSVANSCRFNKPDSAYLVRTLGTPTDVDKWSYSVWVKRANLGANNYLIVAGSNGTNWTEINFNASDDLRWADYQGSYDGQLITDRKFRDVGAWYHLLFAYDADNGVAGNRMRIYVNGVEETSFSTDDTPVSGKDMMLNSAVSHTIGSSVAEGGTVDFDGYMAEVCFIDGQQLTPTSFGEFDEDSPTIFKPIDVSGLTFGNNGFYLDFEDSDNLGDDESGNSLDFTETNIVAADSSTDTPTNNFCVMNPLDDYYPNSTFSEGNCKIVTTASSTTFNTGTFGLSSGLWYFEVEVTTVSDADYIGITGEPSDASDDWAGANEYAWSYYGYTGNVYNDNSYVSYGAAYNTNGIVVGVYLDLNANKIYFSREGVIQNSGTGLSITDPASVPSGVYFPQLGNFHGTQSTTYNVNFGGCPSFTISSAVADTNGYGAFEYDPSDGGSSSFDSAAKDFLAICTKNLGSDGG